MQGLRMQLRKSRCGAQVAEGSVTAVLPDG